MQYYASLLTNYASNNILTTMLINYLAIRNNLNNYINAMLTRC